MSPLGCLPLWGRKGITLIAFLKRMKSDRIFTEPFFRFYRLSRNFGRGMWNNSLMFNQLV